MRELAQIHLFLAHFNDELIVTLVGAVLPLTNRLNHHAHTFALLGAGDELHGSTEVSHIQAAAQALWQGRAQKVNRQALALLAQIHAHLVTGQADNDAPGPIGTAAEIHILDGQDVRVIALGKHSLLNCRGGTLLRRNRFQHHQQALSLDFSTVGGGLLEVENHAGTPLGLYHIDRFQIALVDLNKGAPHGIFSAWKVQRDTGGRLRSKTGRDSSQRLGQINTNHLYATLQGAGHGLNGTLCPGSGGNQHSHCSGCSMPECFHDCDVFLFHFFAPSCSSSDAVRSIQSPVASCTISRN